MATYAITDEQIERVAEEIAVSITSLLHTAIGEVEVSETEEVGSVREEADPFVPTHRLLRRR